MPIRVLIADDDALVREGLRVLIDLDDRFKVVACVSNGKLAVESCEGVSVDVALLDVRMPVLGGLDAAQKITAIGKTRVVILTTFDDDDLIVGALKSGAHGYLLKSATPDRIKDAIRIVADGGTVMQDVVLDRIRDKIGESRKSEFRADLFSERELAVVKAIARGLSNREIAEQLFMSEGTVKNHITSILSKTGLDHRTQIAIYFLTGETP